MTPAEALAKVVTLNPEQTQRLYAARVWLRGEGLLPAWFNPHENRRQGRSTVIAVAALLEALAQPGREVVLVDHAAGVERTERHRLTKLCLVPVLDSILKAYAALDGPGWWNIHLDQGRGRATVSFGAVQTREVGRA